MQTAKRAFENLGTKEQKEYMQGAEAAIRIIDRLEPKLSNTKSAMSVSLQTDSEAGKYYIFSLM